MIVRKTKFLILFTLGEKWGYFCTFEETPLTPKGRSAVFGPFLKFGQAIVDAIFV
jgi:hypothetical protein